MKLMEDINLNINSNIITIMNLVIKRFIIIKILMYKKNHSKTKEEHKIWIIINIKINRGKKVKREE